VQSLESGVQAGRPATAALGGVRRFGPDAPVTAVWGRERIKPIDESGLFEDDWYANDRPTSIGMEADLPPEAPAEFIEMRGMGESHRLPEASPVPLTVNPTQELDAARTPFNLEHSLLLLGREVLVDYAQPITHFWKKSFFPIFFIASSTSATCAASQACPPAARSHW